MLMNHTYFRKAIVCLILVLAIPVSGCKKDRDKTADRTYNVNGIELLPATAGKTKLKTNEQYVAILYANLFQKALSANQIFDISQCMESIGDQEIAREVVISNFMNKPGTIIPSKAQMAVDLDGFIVNTYNRFLVRNPTEAEKTYFNNYITSHITPTDTIMPELVYFSFALSNEYMFY
jgi:hypothetical protein